MSELLPARPHRVPRFVVLSEADADAVVTLLEGFRELLVHGGLGGGQLLLATGGRPVPGGAVVDRLADVVDEAVAVLQRRD
jgi:hypothetical protein